MLRDIDPFEAGQAPHPDVVEVREQKGVDEVPAINGELRVIDGFLRDLETRRAGAEEAAAPAPIQFHFGFPSPGDEKRQIEAKEIVAFDHVRTALFDKSRQTFERGSLGFLDVRRIDHDELFPASVVRKRDAHDALALAGIIDPGYSQNFELKAAELVERKS